MSTQDVPADASAPAIIMVATGTAPATLVLPPNAELGRRVAAAGATHEIDDDRMSRDHATVRFDNGMWVIRDLDSRNGTFVDGDRLVGEQRHRGDLTLRLGGTVFLLVGDGRGHPAATGDTIVGPELGRVHEEIRRHASGHTLLVQGEPGAGKEVAARLYHASGPRSAGPFVAVNCAAIPDGVAERLLFGGQKGAIATIGHFQMARGGTLFLDEISELDNSAQLALERILSVAGDGELGIVAAGHELRAACIEKRMRDELYGKLARAAVTLPPLRARKVDIARLVQLEIGLAAERTQKPLVAHPKLVETCCIRFWPGNVRELRATVKHAAATALEAGRDTVRVEDLPAAAGLAGGTSSGETAVDRPKGASLAIDRATLIAALQRANGVVSTAARALGVHRTQLYKLMDEYGVSHDDVT